MAHRLRHWNFPSFLNTMPALADGPNQVAAGLGRRLGVTALAATSLVTTAPFEAMAAAADAVLAHNAAFDRQWFGRGELPALEAPWICSMEDIRWPAERGLRTTPSVRDLALAYGVPVVQPGHGAFPELIEATGGGLLVEPGSAEALADGLALLAGDPERHLSHRPARLQSRRSDFVLLITDGWQWCSPRAAQASWSTSSSVTSWTTATTPPRARFCSPTRTQLATGTSAPR